MSVDHRQQRLKLAFLVGGRSGSVANSKVAAISSGIEGQLTAG